MALVDIGSLVHLPSIFNNAVGTYVIDAANERACLVFQATRSGTVTKIRWKSGTVTTSKSVRVGIQSVDASNGLNNGTWLGDLGTNLGYGDVASPSASTVYETTLTDGVTLTIGNYYCIVLKWTDDGNFGAMQIICTASFFPAGSWANVEALTWSGNNYGINPTSKDSGNLYRPAFGLCFGSTYYRQLAGPITATASANVTLDSAGSIRSAGNRFLQKFSARALGVWFLGDPDVAMGVHLYSDAGASLASNSVHDVDIRAVNGIYSYFFPFSTPYTMLADTYYRMAVTPTGGAMTIQKIVYAGTEDLAMSDMGSTCHYCTKDATTWSDANTAQRALMSIVIDQIDVAAASSGGGTYGY